MCHYLVLSERRTNDASPSLSTAPWIWSILALFLYPIHLGITTGSSSFLLYWTFPFSLWLLSWTLLSHFHNPCLANLYLWVVPEQNCSSGSQSLPTCGLTSSASIHTKRQKGLLHGIKPRNGTKLVIWDARQCPVPFHYLYSVPWHDEKSILLSHL